MLKKIAIASAAAALFSIGQSASAGQTTNNMTVTATVNKTCVVTTGPSNYSNTYDPMVANATAGTGDLNFTQSVAFKCSISSTGVSVGIDPGLHNSSGRRLADTGAVNFLNYELYQPAGVGSGSSCAGYAQIYTQAAPGLLGVAGTNFTTSATVVTVNICGKIPGGQDVPGTGAYTDTVVVNVNF